MKISIIPFMLIVIVNCFIQFASPHTVGTDPYYHAQASLLGMDLLSKQFPWTQQSLFTNNFADKEFLFHVLLFPFVWLGGLTGAKIATVLFASTAIFAMYLLCRQRNVNTPFLWVILVFAAADLFLYRISITRPHILSLALTLGLCWALLENKRWWVVGFCFLFVYTYTAYHLVIGIAVLYCLNHLLHAKKWDTALFSFAFFGTLLGILLHPHFPNNLLIWKVQNVDVLHLVWSSIDLGFGSEFQPPDSRWFLVNFTVAFFCLPIALFWSSWKQVKMKEDTTYFVFLAFGFFCLSLMSKRFAEYWPVYALLASACLVRDADVPLSWKYLLEFTPYHYRIRKRVKELNQEKFIECADTGYHPAMLNNGKWVTLCITIIAVLFFYRTVSKAMYLNSLEHEPYYMQAALWMKENVPDGETIFHSDWDEFPQLFYYNPENYYLNCLDPIFMYAHNPDIWLLWKQIGRGEIEGLDQVIPEKFNSHWIFLSQEFVGARLQCNLNPNITLRYEDQYGFVYEILHDED